MTSSSSLASNTRTCPICGSSEHEVILQLPATPLGDRYTESEAQALLLPSWPLDVVRCNKCDHCFLPCITEADESYLHYLFGTGQSPGLPEAFKEIVADMLIRHSLSINDLVLDIGANDGSWLECFRDNACDILAVEPAPSASAKAKAKGISVIQDYFSEQSVRASGLLTQPPRIISMNYVFANIPDPMVTLQEIAAISNENTIISVLTGYHPAQLAVGMFDYVYHEHISYYTCKDFAQMANSIGFIVTYAREIPLKGGSIHIEMQQAADGIKQSNLFSTMLKREKWIDQPLNVQWHQIMKQIRDTSDQIKQAISSARSHGLSIVGYGASHSTTTLIYALGIESMIDVVVEDNPAKFCRFSPGTAVPVVPSESINSKCPACVIVLAWQHGPLIKASLISSGFKGQVIIPFPTFTIEQL